MLIFTMLSVSLATPTRSKSSYMDCQLAPFCGILALERGEGKGNYNHSEPSVHGLWPQVGKYGNSQCLQAPRSSNLQKIDVKCYDDEKFQTHEWNAHGVCAARNPQSYFEAVCGLSKAPLAIMKALRDDGKNLLEIMEVLRVKGYPIYNGHLGNDQLALTVCAGTDLEWKIASLSEFNHLCI